jgi:SAM-dependent methyltransferase
MSSEVSRRIIFNQVARDYDTIRPGYPAELINDIIALSALPGDGHILEVGCGTGQATLPFAQRGYAMLCLDIGAEMVAIAREKFRQYPNVRFQVVSFEDWQPGDEPFDLVMSATAWHWVPPEIAYPKAARVLKPTGALAIFGNQHPTPFTGFSAAVQRVYRAVVPEWGDPSDLPPPQETEKATADQIARTGLFEQVRVARYKWTREFTRDEYLRLLNTYSDHRSLDDERRARLFAGIGDVIDKEFGGKVTRPYLSVLYIAKKSAGS